MPRKEEMLPVFKAVTEEKALAIPVKSLKTKRRLTLDATSISRLGELVCRVDGEWEMITTQLGPARAIPVTDCLDMGSYLLICNAMLVSGIERARDRSTDPPGSIAGKFFAIKSGEIVPGKRFRKIDVIELELAR